MSISPPEYADLEEVAADGMNYQHDFDALSAAPSRVILVAGAESEGTLTHGPRSPWPSGSGQEAVIFPSHHAGSSAASSV